MRQSLFSGDIQVKSKTVAEVHQTFKDAGLQIGRVVEYITETDTNEMLTFDLTYILIYILQHRG